MSTFTGTPAAGGTVLVNGVTLTASATLNTGTNFLNTGTVIVIATNLVAAINRQTGTTGISASNVGGTSATVTITNVAAGDAADTLVTETLTNFATPTNTDGAGGAIWAESNRPTVGLPVLGGTGGIVIDNVSATAGASQIYFSTLGLNDCDAVTAGVQACGNAYQASQAALQ